MKKILILALLLSANAFSTGYESLNTFSTERELLNAPTKCKPLDRYSPYDNDEITPKGCPVDNIWVIGTHYSKQRLRDHDHPIHLPFTQDTDLVDSLNRYHTRLVRHDVIVNRCSSNQVNAYRVQRVVEGLAYIETVEGPYSQWSAPVDLYGTCYHKL